MMVEEGLVASKKRIYLNSSSCFQSRYFKPLLYISISIFSW